MSGSENPNLFANCTVETCPLSTSYYNYRIDLAANAVFVGLFSAALVWFLAVWIYTRRGFWFMVAMELGLTAEIIGYVARVFSWKNQWDQDAFLAQIVCITIGPAFFSAAIYLCLERIVVVYGEANSRIPSKWYTRTFIPCDVVSLLLQAIGGIIASVALQNGHSLTTGDNIMIAGLATQVFTLLIFIVLSADFALQVRRRQRHLGAGVALTQEPALGRIRRSWQFKGFMAALGLATILIFWRSGYRVAELNQGWNGPITFQQYLFVGMEPVLIAAAVYALVLFHPAFCLREAMSKMNKIVSAGEKGEGEVRESESPLQDRGAA
ncbi:Sphingoid long-chain base transporter RSB1 [Tolypocladium paradoxum]|uniref:Sphingoid long-chain base transporter RSB1 n=1 Tax=Tolypocladium paradoxum TaxID=94208 RepID=A0A2S4L4V4_9HYPO|nr:Sphingoid long-chain base transporter RSB1 [Tolypocladium paradoxum]